MLKRTGYHVFVNDVWTEFCKGFVGAGLAARERALREPGALLSVELVPEGSERGPQWARYQVVDGALVAWLR
jgi:hypothetical protein